MKSGTWWSTLPSGLILLSLCVQPADAQDVGKVQGRVTDAATHQPIANAQVIILGTRLGNITNADGYYFINNVPADLQDIQAQYIGYRVVTVQQQRVLAGQTVTRDFALRQSAIEIRAIEVIGERTPLVPRDQVASKMIVTGDAVDQLPVDNMLALLRLQPGVVQTGRGNGISIRGGRAGEEAVFVDGVLVRNFNRGISDLTVGTNSVAEVDVLTGGFSAQYGDAQSGIINYVTRSGGRRWNGTFSLQTDELMPKQWSVGFNRAELALGGPLFRNLSVFLATTASGQKFAEMPKTWRNFPFYVPEGLDTAITYDLGDGNLRTVNVPNFVRYDQAGHTPWSNSDEYTMDAKLDYTYGSGSRLFLTRKISRNQNRSNFGAGRANLYSRGIPLPSGDGVIANAALGTQSKSQTTILGWTHNFLRNSESALALDVKIARQHDFLISNSLLDPEWDLSHRDPRFGFTFDDMQFVVNTKNWPIDQALLDRFTRNDPTGVVPFENRTDFRGRADYRMNPYGVRTELATVGIAGGPGYANAEEWQWQYRAALDWQINRQHRIKVGVEHFDIDTRRYVANSLIDRSFMQLWIEHPKRQSAFVQERLDLGDVVVESGLRYDRFDPNSVFPIVAGFYDPDNSPENVAALQSAFPDRKITSTFEKARVRSALSPRLGVSFPVTVNSTFRLSYGHFTQLPDLRYYYWGKNKDYFRFRNTNSNDNFSAGGLELGRTVAFEFGFRQLLAPDFVLDIAAYNRDKMRDVSNRLLYWPNPLNLGETKYLNTFVNADFGAIRGIDVRLDRRIGQVFDMMLGYSYQNAKNTGTDPFTYQSIFARLESNAASLLGLPPNPAQAMRLTEENRTHNVTSSFSLQFPRTYHIAALRNTGLFGTFRRISGLPYSPMDSDLGAALFVAGEGGTTGPNLRDDEVNTARMPWQTYFDLKLSRGLRIAGMNASAFIDARNVLDLSVQTRTVLTTGDITDEHVYQLRVEAHRQALGGGVMQDRIDLHSLAAAGVGVSNPVDLYLLQQAEARFGDGDQIFTAEEQTRAFKAEAYYLLGPQDMFGPGRRVRIGLELSF